MILIILVNYMILIILVMILILYLCRNILVMILIILVLKYTCYDSYYTCSKIYLLQQYLTHLFHFVVAVVTSTVQNSWSSFAAAYILLALI
jgi:hypothetical protein